jgi:hypothetical protein
VPVGETVVLSDTGQVFALLDGVRIAHRNNLLVALDALPVFSVAIRERDLASTGVDAFDSGLAATVESPLDCGAVRQLDPVGFECDWKAFIID